MDYSGYSELLEFGPGVSVVHAGIPILADNTYEELESFTIELKQPPSQSNQSGVRIDSSRSMARVDIIDDDSEINIIFNSSKFHGYIIFLEIIIIAKYWQTHDDQLHGRVVSNLG